MESAYTRPVATVGGETQSTPLELFPALLTASGERRYAPLSDGIRASAWSQYLT